MLKELFDRIVEIGQQAKMVEIVTVEEMDYVDSHLLIPPSEPRVLPINLQTLNGLADFVKANIDGLEWSKHLCLVHGPCVVHVLSLTEGRHKTRQHTLLVETEDLNWDRVQTSALDQEAFSAHLQSLCAPTPDRDVVLTFISKVQASHTAKVHDDGIAQSATVAEGVATLANERVENPVYLRPFRTFPEVDQPESPFILRLKSEDGGISMRLFEADGGRWRLEAVKNIATFLEGLLEGTGLRVVY